MLDKPLLQRKLDQITDYLDDLVKVAQTPRQKFVGSLIHYEAERLIELVVGTALDINFHIIKILDLPAPTNYRESFTILGKANVLPHDLAQKIAGSAGLRNLLVHDYQEVDLDRLYDGLKGGIEDYKKYVKAIFDYMAKH